MYIFRQFCGLLTILLSVCPVEGNTAVFDERRDIISPLGLSEGVQHVTRDAALEPEDTPDADLVPARGHANIPDYGRTDHESARVERFSPPQFSDFIERADLRLWMDEENPVQAFDALECVDVVWMSNEEGHRTVGSVILVVTIFGDDGAARQCRFLLGQVILNVPEEPHRVSVRDGLSGEVLPSVLTRERSTRNLGGE